MNTVTFSVFSDAKSPFWLAQLVLSDGKRVKRSTKVPVAGGMFRGEKLTRAQAKNRALMVAQELANVAAVRAAFAWDLDAELIVRNPCDGVKVPADGREERVVHEAFTPEEIQVLLCKLPDEWVAAVRCCLGTYGQRLGDVRALRWEQFDWQEGWCG